MSQSTRIVRPTRMTGAIAAAVTAAWPPVPQVSGDAAYCLNSLVSSPMPSIATVTVLTGSFMTPTPTDVPQAIRSPGSSVMWGSIAFSSEADTASPGENAWKLETSVPFGSSEPSTAKALRHGEWSTSRRAGRVRRDALIQFLIDDLYRAVDFGIGCAKLMRNQLHQQVDAFDGRRATSDRPGR